ncbi:nuclear transport factor 2 family protein [Streptomyces camelliae]|uniref:Nuclear transport factor 2 family protein n=1 Tax=Streptomyces camelliae TaxID=3004093 RepID=A0ABY7PH22_9ACTN|nr:nuclear transport factor 2 family protein [Streptomyces sp. HUAS 2-6]WBO68897.1 nuclear transport factor 2 family protein [Streptomyces sp. HUAS 2-6]
MSASPSTMTARLRRAVEAAHWQSLAGLLHPDVACGPPEEGGSVCRGRSRVLSHFARPGADGLRATVDETFTYPAAVVLGLHLAGAGPAPGPPPTVYQVYDLADGLIIRVTEYADRAEALGAAYPSGGTGL